MISDDDIFSPESAMTVKAALAWERHKERVTKIPRSAAPPRQPRRKTDAITPRAAKRKPAPNVSREVFGAWADGTPYAVYYQGLYEMASGRMRRNGTRKRADEEGAEQIACVRWFRATYPQYSGLLHASAGGVFASARQKAKMSDMGYVKGTPDFALLVVTRTRPGCFMEMKRTRGGKVSAEQHEIADALEDQGYEVHRNVKGFRMFREIVDNYLNE